MDKILLEQIHRINELISEIEYSDYLLGGTKTKIPTSNSHKGKDWQSANAWDIGAPVGTPVFALTSGSVRTWSDYGESVIKIPGKKLYGQSFTVTSDNGLPDVYYTHLKNSKVKKGDSVKCGDLLGYIMDFPGSSFDHVHIGVQNGHNIRELISDDGKIKCSKVGRNGTSVTNTEDSDLSDLLKILDNDFEGKKIADILNIKPDDVSQGSDMGKNFLDILSNFVKGWEIFKK